MTQYSKSECEAAAAVAGMTAGKAVEKSEALELVRSSFGVTPDTSLVDSEIRRWFALFSPEAHAEDLARKRRAALFAMKALADWHPVLIGPVLSGAATTSDIPEILLRGNEKEVELFLLSREIDFDVLSSAMSARHNTVTLLTGALQTDIVITVSDRPKYPRATTPDSYQSPLEAAGKAEISALEALLLETISED